MTDNLALWNKYRTPHKDALKNFTKRGGFSGTAIDPMWAIRAATEEWGPMGRDWGYTIELENVRTLSDKWVLHTINIDLWYHDDSRDKMSAPRVPSVGSTWLVSPKTDGTLIYDDEAPKKSRTDAISKALSWLGFGADIYMGRHSSSKYSDLDAPEETEPETREQHDPLGADAFDVSIARDKVKANTDTAVALVGKEKHKPWHDRVLSNFYNCDTYEDLNYEQLVDFAEKQQQKIGDYKE